MSDTLPLTMPQSDTSKSSASGLPYQSLSPRQEATPAQVLGLIFREQRERQYGLAGAALGLFLTPAVTAAFGLPNYLLGAVVGVVSGAAIGGISGTNRVSARAKSRVTIAVSLGGALGALLAPLPWWLLAGPESVLSGYRYWVAFGSLIGLYVATAASDKVLAEASRSMLEIAAFAAIPGVGIAILITLGFPHAEAVKGYKIIGFIYGLLVLLPGAFRGVSHALDQIYKEPPYRLSNPTPD